MDSEEDLTAPSGFTAPTDVSPFQPSLHHSEELQILLFGAPGTGKTRLQSRYTLRQFVDIVDESAHRMGGHKYLQMLDGINVHLIIHELSSGATAQDSTATVAERCHRKKLLEKCDAVMLLFNPWSKQSFDWADDTLVEDILDTGNNRRLTRDIFGLLNGTSGSAPKPPMIMEAPTTLDIISKTLPERPDPRENGASLFPMNEEKKGLSPERIALGAKVRPISNLTEGTVLTSEPSLLSPQPAGLAPRPTIVRRISGLPDIKEANKTQSQLSPRQNKRAAMLVDKEDVRKSRRDSGISLQSESGRLSRYSESSTMVGSQRRSFTEFEHLNAKETQLSEATAHESIEESEIPVIVVATMTDRLQENGGDKPRVVTRTQGQQLARRFGLDSGYIEASARSNSNVDHAFGIVVDQVMTKRRRERRDSMVRAFLARELAGASIFKNIKGGRATGRRAQRSCMPGWRLPWLATAMNMISRAFSSGTQNGSASAGEDVWGEGQHAQGVESRTEKYASRSYAATAAAAASKGTSLPGQTQLSDKLSARVMSHGPEIPGPLISKPSYSTIRTNARRETITPSAYEPEKYTTVLKVVNPDTHETEKPPHHAIPQTQNKLDEAVERTGESDKSEIADAQQEQKADEAVTAESAGPAAAAEDARHDATPPPQELPPDYDSSVSNHGDSSQDLPQQQQASSENAPMAISALPSAQQGDDGDITTDTTATMTTAATVAEPDKDRRVSSVSVVFRPASYQPSAGENQASFVLILSPSKINVAGRPDSLQTTASISSAAQDDDDDYFAAVAIPEESANSSATNTTTTTTPATATAIGAELVWPLPPSSKTDGQKEGSEKRKRRKTTVEEALSSSSSKPSTGDSSSSSQPSAPAPVPAMPALPLSAITNAAPKKTIRNELGISSTSIPANDNATAIVVPPLAVPTSKHRGKYDRSKYASTVSMASVLRYYVDEAGATEAAADDEEAVPPLPSSTGTAAAAAATSSPPSDAMRPLPPLPLLPAATRMARETD